MGTSFLDFMACLNATYWGTIIVGGYIRISSMDDVEILCKEYDALRQEVTTGLSGRNTILSIWVAALGVVVSSGVALMDSHSQMVSWVFTLVVPVVNSLILLLWFGEYKRVQNAGKLLYGLESKINTRAKKTLLTLETRVRNERREQKKYRLDYTTALLSIVSFFSLIFGLGKLNICIQVKLLLGAAVVLYIVIVYIQLVRRIHKLRTEIPNENKNTVSSIQ